MNPETRQILGYQLIEKKRERDNARHEMALCGERLVEASRTLIRLERLVADLEGDLSVSE